MKNYLNVSNLPMKKNITLIIILIVVLFSSCKKDKVGITYVPKYLKQMLPYSNGQTISFTDSTGNTLDATISVASAIIEKSNCASCPVYAKDEYINYNFFVGTHPFVQISVDVRPYIFMGIFSPLDNYQQGNGFDFMVEEGKSQPVCNGPRQTCLSSIVLNGRIYTNILEVISGATDSMQLTKAYYSATQGLIGFKYGSGFTYTKQ